LLTYKAGDFEDVFAAKQAGLFPESPVSNDFNKKISD
jgi:hypothetical protein